MKEEEEEDDEEEQEEESSESEEEDEEEAPKEDVPEEEDVWEYKPVDKFGKEFKNPVEVEIIKVYPKNKTADVKNLTNDRIYKAVPWGKLIAKG